jgi:serine phosphatase RsbU (regulator of sigma subunit)
MLMCQLYHTTYRIGFLFLLFSTAFFNNSFSQVDKKEQGLMQLLKHSENDSLRCLNLMNLANHFLTIDKNKSLFYSIEAVKLATSIKNGALLGNAYIFMADAYWYSFNNKKAVNYYLLAKRVADSIGNQRLKAKSMYNIGWIKCIQQKESDQAHYLYQSFAIFQKLKDTSYCIILADAMGSYYRNFERIPKYQDSVKHYFLSALYQIEHSNYKANESACHSNLGNFYVQTHQFKEALYHYRKADSVAVVRNQDYSHLIAQQGIADVYTYTGNYTEALKIAKEILPKIENDELQKENLQAIYRILSESYEAKKDYPHALEYHKKFKVLTDTLNSNIFRSNLKAQEDNYQNELNEKTIIDLTQRNELSDLRIKNNNILIYALSGIVLLIVLVLIMLFRYIGLSKKTNKILSIQNKEISLKKEEIEQSIQYAKGIQSGILSEKEILQEIIPENFIFYLPKDIVSGDFYWFQKLENGLLLAAADCTGHGVPGALMSVVSIDRLNQAVFEQNLNEPTSILKAINQSIKHALKQNNSATQHKDGLDIALIHYSPEKLQLTYAGANRPLWIIRNGELIEYKPTKSSIAGHSPNDQHYPQIEIGVQKNDLLFLFSDGYADQFGGLEGKKLMTKNFKDLLVQNCSKPIHEIYQVVENHFSQWKKGFEQVDDVLVIGLKI